VSSGTATNLVYYTGSGTTVGGDTSTSDDGAGNIGLKKITLTGTGPLAITAAAGLQLPKGVFSSFPACSGGIEGDTAAMTDTNLWGAIITGGGTNHVLAYCDGTGWTVVGK
jgi:hypothetical protein